MALGIAILGSIGFRCGLQVTLTICALVSMALSVVAAVGLRQRAAGSRPSTTRTAPTSRVVSD